MKKERLDDLLIKTAELELVDVNKEPLLISRLNNVTEGVEKFLKGRDQTTIPLLHNFFRLSSVDGVIQKTAGGGKISVGEAENGIVVLIGVACELPEIGHYKMQYIISSDRSGISLFGFRPENDEWRCINGSEAFEKHVEVVEKLLDAVHPGGPVKSR